MNSPGRPVTVLLRAWRDGDDDALSELMPLVYDELRRLARSQFQHEREGHTLQPTAVVHEAFGRLVSADVTISDRTHFFALCARLMRRVLMDHARGRLAQKRGGDFNRVTLAEEVLGEEGVDLRLLSLNESLDELAERSPRKVELIELQLFGGLTVNEIGRVMQLSVSTVERELRFTKAWLAARLSES